MIHYMVLRVQPLKVSGDNYEKDTPVPIPNTAVKLLSADDTWDFVPGKVGRCRIYIKTLRETVRSCLRYKET